MLDADSDPRSLILRSADLNVTAAMTALGSITADLDGSSARKRKPSILTGGESLGSERAAKTMKMEDLSWDDGVISIPQTATRPLPVHDDFMTGDFCLVSTDEVEFHIDSFHLRSASGTFRGLFAISSGKQRVTLDGELETSKYLSTFLRLVSGDLSPLKTLGLDQIVVICKLCDKWECLTLQTLLRLQLPRLLTCAKNSRFTVFVLAASYQDWQTCAEAIRASPAATPWPKLDTPHSCLCHHGERTGLTTSPIPLDRGTNSPTLLEPSTFDVARWNEFGGCMPAFLALVRACEYSKISKGKVIGGTVACYFLNAMLEHDSKLFAT